MAKQTRGFCKYCGKEYTRSGMLKHLAACKDRAESIAGESGKNQCGYFELVLYGKYAKDYWLIIEISENATLEELDQFIRDVWVECCGHLSMFEINGIRYEIDPEPDYFWGPPAKSMKCKLREVLEEGIAFSYDYDFGSTTELLLNVHSYRTGKQKQDEITILSRNNPLDLRCSICGENKADWVNPMGFYDGTPLWCEECLKEAEAEEEEAYEDEGVDMEGGVPEFLLPVCNSPRCGVCGYDGSRKYPDQFEPDVKKK